MSNDLAIYGEHFVDVVYTPEEPFESIEDDGDYPGSINIKPGGKSNIAYWAAENDLSSIVLGDVGSDIFSEAYQQHLRDLGATDSTTVTEGSIGVGIALPMNSSRVLFTDPGANTGYRPDRENVQANYHLFSGNSMRDKATIDSIKEQVKSVDNSTVFELGSLNDVSNYPNEFKDVIGLSDIVFMNTAEYNALGITEDEIQDLSEDKTIVVTNSSQIRAYENGEVYTKEIEKQEDVDATGAGDGFIAGFLSGDIENESVEECLDRGHATSLDVLEVSGGQPSNSSI